MSSTTRLAALGAGLLLAPVAGAPSQFTATQLIVETVDGRGVPTTAAFVAWYLDGGSSVAPGRCLDARCTRWTWSDVPGGAVVISAVWSGPHPELPDCTWFGYGARPVSVPANGSVTVRLHVVVEVSCGGAISAPLR